LRAHENFDSRTPPSHNVSCGTVTVKRTFETLFESNGFAIKRSGDSPFAVTVRGQHVRRLKSYEDAMAVLRELERRKFGVEATNPDQWRPVATLMTARRRHRAARRGLPFAITPEMIYQKMEKNGFRCALSGMPFHLPRRDDPSRNAMDIDPWAPSIDRIDHRLGYVPGNVRVVSIVANYALNRFGSDTLLQLAQGVVDTLAFKIRH
jgi:hypothetical protein